MKSKAPTKLLLHFLTAATTLLRSASLCAVLLVGSLLVNSSAHAAGDDCDTKSSNAWITVNELVGAIPGTGSFFKLATQLSKVGRAWMCNQDTDLVMLKITEEIERIVGQRIDDNDRNDLARELSALGRTLNVFDGPELKLLNPESFHELSDSRRKTFLTRLDAMYVAAAVAESSAEDIRWPVFPMFAQAVSMKLGALNLIVLIHQLQLQYGTFVNDSDRTEVQELLDDALNDLQVERYESNRILGVLEADFSSALPWMSREFHVASKKYRIDVEVLQRGKSPLYEKHWSCTKNLPRQCKTYNSRKVEFFGDARTIYRAARTTQIEAFETELRKFKRSLYLGPVRAAYYTDKDERVAFLVRGGRRRGVWSAGNLAQEVCIEANSVAAFETRPCDRDQTKQYFQWLPASGQLYSTYLQVCLAEVSGKLAGVPCLDAHDGSQANDSEAYNSQSWSFLPSGQLINFKSGKCIGLTSSITKAQVDSRTFPADLRSSVTLAGCDLGLSGFSEVIDDYNYSNPYIDYLEDGDLGEDVWSVVPTGQAWQAPVYP